MLSCTPAVFNKVGDIRSVDIVMHHAISLSLPTLLLWFFLCAFAQEQYYIASLFSGILIVVACCPIMNLWSLPIDEPRLEDR